MELLLQAIGSFAIGFVQDEDVADLHQSGFHVLNIVAKAWNKNDEDAIGETDDIDFILADANGFDQHLTLPCRIEEQSHFGGSAGQPAEKPARGHGADENACVRGVALHANAIAQNRASGIRAGGINGDDANGFLALAVIRGQAIDQRALARARGAGNAGEIGLPGMREQDAQQLFALQARGFRWRKWRER